MKPQGTKTLHTPRLLLRRMEVSDAGDVFRNYAADYRVTRFLAFPPYTREEDGAEYLASVAAQYASPDYYYWGIVLEGQVIGSISVTDRNKHNTSFELGYCIGHAFWGQGLMTEAVEAVMDYLFREVEVHRICAKHDVENPASGRVMEKAGMRREGVLQDFYLRPDGTTSDAVLYAMVRQEWQIRQEIAYYNALPGIFDRFMPLPQLTDGELTLRLIKQDLPIPEKKWVLNYQFSIERQGVHVGETNLRTGYTEGLYYGGQIGYNIDEAYRGRGYAGRACRLLLPAARVHGLKVLLITNDVGNTASRRVCEKLGAEHIRTARLPQWHDLYKDGGRYVNIYALRVEG